MKDYNPPKMIVKTDDSERRMYEKVYGKSLNSFWEFILWILFGYK